MHMCMVCFSSYRVQDLKSAVSHVGLSCLNSHAAGWPKVPVSVSSESLIKYHHRCFHVFPNKQKPFIHLLRYNLDILYSSLLLFTHAEWDTNIYYLSGVKPRETS